MGMLQFLLEAFIKLGVKFFASFRFYVNYTLFFLKVLLRQYTMIDDIEDD